MDYYKMCQRFGLASVPSPDGRFTIDELIGEGTYGEVFRARDTVTGENVAIKILEDIAGNEEEIEDEYLALRDLSLHPNIPSFHGIYFVKGSKQLNDQLWFVMELCQGGSVTDLVHGLKIQTKQLTEDQIAYILHETLQALAFLHRNHCMHRDVKGHNILLTEDGQVKLVDFGVSSHLGATMGRRDTSVGTPYWMAPEVIACEQQRDSSYDSRCDVWSLGITAIELATGDPPLSGLHPMRALFQIPRDPPPVLPLSARPDAPRLTHFVARCLIKDFEQRPTTAILIHDPFIVHGSKCIHRVREELKAEIRYQKEVSGRVQKHPDVTTKHGKLKSKRKNPPTTIYVDDLAALDSLSEERIVNQLKKRYQMNLIYTYIGDILLAINPFTSLSLYTSAEQKKYCNQMRAACPPHIFAIADSAYQFMLHEKANQSIVISGESGAGKTESGNLLLKQLVYLGKAPNRNLEQRILQMNPIMEAFGNARTGINNNSSRFGKFLELSMTRSGQLTGARVSVYLLEQSRVIQQANGESNFHAFYYIYDGLEHDKRLKEFHLDRELRQMHSYLPSDRQDSKTKQNNVDKFAQLKNAFEQVGFIEEEVNSIYCILAAILHLGDIEFSEIMTDNNTDNKSTVIDLTPIHRTSCLLDIESSDLLECLSVNSVVTRGEIIQRNNSVSEAVATRDAIARALYSRLFDWLVNSINSLLSFHHTRGEYNVIGILDIFGFENFTYNSFEQLCINIANEQLQYFFNQHVFALEQAEYESEGVPVQHVGFCDNRPVLDMLVSRPMGLLALLDEESRFPRATDRSLVEKFHCNIKCTYYVRPKSNALQFEVKHFAGNVTYQATGMLEKNRHLLAIEAIQVLRKSSNKTVRALFQCPVTKTGNLYSQDSSMGLVGLASQSRGQQTAATYFRHSLAELLHRMGCNNSGVSLPRFVRCIKPNDQRKPKQFDPLKVVAQLRCSGVMETIRIRRNGYSHRLLFKEFINRYAILGFRLYEKVPPTRDNCRHLLVKLKLDGWAIGKTKVFLKYYHIEHLTKLHEKQLRHIIIVQSCIRRWLAMKHYREALLAKQMSWGVLTLQKHARGWLARQKKKKTKGEIPVGEVAPIYRQEPRENDISIKNQNKVSPTIVSENKKTYIQQNGVKVLPCKIQQKVEREKHLIDFAKNKGLVHNAIKKLVTENYCKFDSDNRLNTITEKPNNTQPINKSNWVSPLRLTPPDINRLPEGFDFRQLLRPTQHAPTESLRKRLVQRSRPVAANAKG
ncbi:Protein kinase, ATP binding site,Protein kinase domain,Serine/threonine-protein kinase, active site,Myosin [Cinara cedri]|uniref:non-specific serine/threonine protein kinase n=2 Tax=Cinara cedri TaxID=506608 RepID=A0A5E4M781_9HEMI|nr:Protein kinase, ATP binding site,Protein kinase domain,Serine/threonine-protein kinase, active site,Myosin [Cinara cedri]